MSPPWTASPTREVSVKSLALILLAFPFALTTACDGAPVERSAPDESGAITPRDTLALGRVVFEGDDLVPAAQVQVLLDLTTSDDQALEPITVTTDADGHFEVPTLPPGVVSMTAHVFVDGEHAGSDTVPVADGAPVRRAIIAIAVTATVVCIATTWASARKISGSDKLRHCVASCRTARWCGVGSAFTAAVLKEIFDSLCKYGPQWLKDLLSPVSGCGGWDNADMAANTRGIWCSGRWKTCENCCNDYY